MKNIKRIFIAVVLLLPLASFANELPVALNGFYLWQLKDGVRQHFGKPDKIQENDNVNMEAHWMSNTSYMVFEYPKEKYIHNVSGIQVTGYPTKMAPFKGVVLGDSLNKVEKIVGKSDSIRKVEGTAFTLHIYDHQNYDFEFDDKNRLYSIRLYITKDFMNKTDPKFKTWDRFKEVVAKKDVKSILRFLRPDFEIYMNGKTYSVKRRYADFLNKPDEKIIKAIVGGKNSIKAAISESEPESELRLIKGMGVGLVFKFYKGSIVREIVMFPYNGKYSIYEVEFCKNKDCGWNKKNKMGDDK